jgi:hypothetical protein
MKKLVEHTYGRHIFMRIEMPDGAEEEIDAYIRAGGWSYSTSADDRSWERREEIIAAFQELY